MKNRHLMGALLAFVPAIAIAQVSSTPPVGNASETVANGTTADPLPDSPGIATESQTDVGTGSTTGTTGTTTTMPDPTTGSTSTRPNNPDPTAPKPRG